MDWNKINICTIIVMQIINTKKNSDYQNANIMQSFLETIYGSRRSL